MIMLLNEKHYCESLVTFELKLILVLRIFILSLNIPITPLLLMDNLLVLNRQLHIPSF